MAYVLTWCMLAICCAGCGVRHEPSPEEKAKADGIALQRVLYVQSLYNLHPGKEVLPRIRATVDSMRRDGRNPYYYAAVNVLIDRLFSEGRFSQADSLAVSMAEEARQDNDSISIAMAHRVRAQMLYKLFIPRHAKSELETASSYITHPYNSGSDFGTATSVKEWQWIVAKRLRDTVAMNRAGLEYARLVEENSSINRLEDPTEHYPVTALAFRAQAAIATDSLHEAALLLDSASRMVDPSIPSRCYEHLYAVRSSLRALRKNWTGALEDVDTLLSTHRDFPWFYLNDLLAKADILEKEGRYSEAAQILRKILTTHDSITKEINVRRIKDLTVLHRAEVDREHQRARKARNMTWGALTVFLAILLAVTVHAIIKERKLNRLLVERLKEFDQSGDHNAGMPDPLADPDTPYGMMERLDHHMIYDRPYTDPALGRKELSEFLGISQDALGQLVKEERGVSVKTYINAFRLEEARRLLGSDANPTISDLAAMLGFGTARTLQRAFKERYAMSPTQYRDTLRQLDNTDSQ